MNVEEAIISPISSFTGLSYDKVYYGIAIIFCFVNGFTFRTLFGVGKVTSSTRHYVSIVSGVAILFFCFGYQAFHLVVLTFVGLFLLIALPRKYVHLGVFVYAMTHNSIVHIQRMLSGNPKTFDLTAPMMFATIRIVYVGFAFHEASKHTMRKENGEKTHNNNNDNKSHLQREHPSTLEVFSYMFFFSSICVGPTSDFHSFKHFIDGSDIQAKTDLAKYGKPSPLVPALKKFGLGLFCVFVFIQLESNGLCPERYLDPTFVKEKSFWQKVLFSEISLYSAKFQYLNVFFLSEACVNMAGFGFNGYDKHGNALWDGLIYSNIIEFEKALGVQDFTNTWNIPTKIWLKKCVYAYVTFMPTLTVFAVSALWHGFYLGYYMFFVPMGLALLIQRGIYKKVHMTIEASKFWKLVYIFANFIFARIIMHYYHMVFFLRDYYSIFLYWRSVYFYGHVIYFFGAAILFLLPNPKYA